MLPYFKFTEEVQGFCELMGFTIDNASLDKYTCMYELKYFPTPYITSYTLDPDMSPYIPSEKVLEYLTLMLNGYSHHKAVNELNVVG